MLTTKERQSCSAYLAKKASDEELFVRLLERYNLVTSNVLEQLRRRIDAQRTTAEILR